MKLVLVAATALIAWWLKRYYANATVEDLVWILAPTAWLSGTITDTAFTFQGGEGYLSRERMFLIEKSCAGINFLIAAFALLALTRAPRGASPVPVMRLLARSLAVAYAAAVVVNAARISIAMWLARWDTGRAMLGAAEIHRLEGIVVYFGGLLLLYEGTRWLDDRATDHVRDVNHGANGWRRAAAPLVAYYTVTIVLPLVNGGRGGAFVRHAVVVALVPPVMILIGGLSATLLARIGGVTAASATCSHSRRADARPSP